MSLLLPNFTKNVPIIDVKMQIGDKKLSSRLIEKKEARDIYKKGIENKHKSLLLEKNDHTYLIKVGNIEPHEKIIGPWETWFDIEKDYV